MTSWTRSFRQPRERLQDHPLATMHPAGFFLTSFMIIATEMQNAVDQEYRQLFLQRSLALSGLTSGRRHRNHHITQQV